jgi:hypothetical protein
MAAKKQINIWLLVTSIALSSYSMCAADEVVFKNQGAKQVGTVVEETEQGVTIIFPKGSIKSITRSKDGGPRPSSSRVILEDSGAYITVKIPRQRLEGASPETLSAAEPARQEPSSADPQLREKVERLERKLESMEKTGASQPGAAPIKGTTHEALLQEEMGSLEGVILWNGKPLKDARVKIVLDKYTGFSVTAVRKVFGGKVDEKSQGIEDVTIDTQTDSRGHYSFSQVPPGFYTIFWQPDPQTGWVRRLRETADLEVVSGKLTVLNIPEKKKKM